MNDVVMGGTSCALETSVRCEKLPSLAREKNTGFKNTLKEEIVVVDGSDTSVNHSAWPGVTLTIRLRRLGRVESSMMAFSLNMKC